MKILIIGFGTMGQAIAGALKKTSRSFDISALDKNSLSGNPLIKKLGIKQLKSYPKTGSFDFVILSVKPQDMAELAGDIKHSLGKQGVLVSIAAGLPIKKISSLFSRPKVIRMMPNLALSVGQGIAGWKASWKLSTLELKKVNRFFSAFTEHFPVRRESELNAITAISGSGPAYFFYLAASLEHSAQKLGFSPKEARALVEKTFSGAAVMQKGADYKTLISRIASKKGTTEAAIKIFNNKKTDKIIQEAVKAAFKRAEELSHE